ncbi:hypothetical protein D3C72_111220 [compost metagenome]
MGLRSSRRMKALLGLTAAALSAGCPPVNPPPGGGNPNDAADRQAITALLSDADVQPFFQSRLINDGVGIFGGGADVVPSGMPRRWGRSYATTVQAEEMAIAQSTSIQFASETEASGLYKRSRGGKLVLDYTWQRQLLSKPFVETTLRTARFRKSGGAWNLTDVNLSRIQPEDSKLKAGLFALSADGQAVRRFHPGDWLSVADLPRARPGSRALIEVELSHAEGSGDQALYAFLYVPPSGDRLRLRDDGLHGDKKARDGVFSAEFLFPSQPGLGHLVIDAIAGKTFVDPATTNYDATQWGIPYRVEGGEAR